MPDITPTPTGLYGPGDFGPEFVTIDAMLEDLRALDYMVTSMPGHGGVFIYPEELRCRQATRDAILDLAHDLDARGLVTVPEVANRKMMVEGHGAFDESKNTGALTGADVGTLVFAEIWDAMVEVGSATFPPRPPEPAYTANADLATGGE